MGQFKFEFNSNALKLDSLLNCVLWYWRCSTYGFWYHSLNSFSIFFLVSIPTKEMARNIKKIYNFIKSRGSLVSIASDYGLDDRGSIPDRGRGFFF
jgi:hypothetical protein